MGNEMWALQFGLILTLGVSAFYRMWLLKFSKYQISFQMGCSSSKTPNIGTWSRPTSPHSQKGVDSHAHLNDPKASFKSITMFRLEEETTTRKHTAKSLNRNLQPNKSASRCSWVLRSNKRRSTRGEVWFGTLCALGRTLGGSYRWCPTRDDTCISIPMCCY